MTAQQPEQPDSNLESSHAHTPGKDEVAEAEKESRSLHQMKRFWATLAALIVLAVVMVNVSSGGAQALADSIMRHFTGDPASEAEERRPTSPLDEETLLIGEFDNHPDYVFQPYVAGPILGSNTESSDQLSLVEQFRSFLDVYVQRQAIDDNFTIRVVDGRNNEVLEIFELEEERQEYEERGQASYDYWMGTIDGMRRAATNRLVDKYARQGIPRGPIMVKWGRATQIAEAHDRNSPYFEYEVRLSQYLDMSLLVTQISTVETFNQDRLVSSVGARSRFQMMPYLLNQNDINQYRLRTKSGGTVLVREEWHPLLTMEPAFKIARGYANAVGHEIPGISAYHTGPNNIYKVYRQFMTQATRWFNPNSTVMDAYMWATGTNDGYQTMRSNTSFGPFSRGYVASAYGALKALDEEPLDTAATVRAERVQLKAGSSVLLSDLLTTLKNQPQGGLVLPESQPAEQANTATSDTPSESAQERQSLYNYFRRLNPHIPLPTASDNTSGVPDGGNIRLVSSVNGDAVRFFLPLGAAQKLEQAGVDIFESVFAFDRNTYSYPAEERTVWDDRYDMLVDDISRFGFTNRNRQRLYDLERRFRQLAQQNPSDYRQDQLEIIQTHKRIWSTRQWEQIRNTTESAFGQRRAPVRPPSPLDSLLAPPQLSAATAIW